jgi:hypothetical protein
MPRKYRMPDLSEGGARDSSEPKKSSLLPLL